MFRTFLAAAAALIITSNAIAGTMVADPGSVAESEMLFDQRTDSSHLVPMQPMTYPVPYDIAASFKAYRAKYCTDTQSVIERVSRPIVPVAHENIIDRMLQLLDAGIKPECIITIIGDDVEFGEPIHHKLVLSTEGDHVFTEQGNIPWREIGTTSFRYYVMEAKPERLLLVGIKN